MEVIITGANGFIGSSLVDYFYSKGHRVFGIVKDKKQDVSSIEDKCTIVYCELDNLESIKELFLEPNERILYHLAWQGVNGPGKADFKIQLHNIEMCCDCANFAKSIGCKKILFAGTIAERSVDSLGNIVKTSSGMMYGVAKLSARRFVETLCKNIGLKFVWMQFSNIYGPKNKTGNLISYTLNQLFNNQEAEYGPADQPYDFVFVDDLIKAAYLLGTSVTTKDFYFVGSGTPRILKDYLFKVGDLMGKPNLIVVGKRPDDGVKYDFSMLETAILEHDIGPYVSMSFEEAIKYTIENY